MQTLHPVLAIVSSKLLTFYPSLRIFNFDEFVKTDPIVFMARHWVKKDSQNPDDTCQHKKLERSLQNTHSDTVPTKYQ